MINIFFILINMRMKGRQKIESLYLFHIKYINYNGNPISKHPYIAYTKYPE